MGKVSVETSVDRVTLELDGEQAEVLAGLFSRLQETPPSLGYLDRTLRKYFPDARSNWAIVTERGEDQRHIDPLLIPWGEGGQEDPREQEDNATVPWPGSGL